MYLFAFCSTFCLCVVHRKNEKLCLWAPEERRCVKYWSQHHCSFLTGQTDSVTTILSLLCISYREYVFLVVHFLTAGKNVGSATQQWFKVLLKDTTAGLRPHWSMDLSSLPWGTDCSIWHLLQWCRHDSWFTDCNRSHLLETRDYPNCLHEFHYNLLKKQSVSHSNQFLNWFL